MYVLPVWNDVAYYDNPVCASEASCKLHLKRVIDFPQPNCRHICPMVSSTDAGRSAARLARSVRDAEVGGSNPLAPTSFPQSQDTARDERWDAITRPAVFLVRSLALTPAACGQHPPSQSGRGDRELRYFVGSGGRGRTVARGSTIPGAEAAFVRPAPRPGCQQRRPARRIRQSTDYGTLWTSAECSA